MELGRGKIALLGKNINSDKNQIFGKKSNFW